MTSKFWMVVYVYNNLVSLKKRTSVHFLCDTVLRTHVSPQFQREMSTELH